jgi:hypothetical protein
MIVGPKMKIRLRRVPALDSIDEAVGMAAEKGDPIVYSYGNLVFSSAMMFNCSTQILGYVMRKAAVAKVRVFRFTKDPAIFAAMEDMAQQACIQVGHSEMYNRSDGFYCATDGVVNMMQAATIGKYHCCAYIAVGLHMAAFQPAAIEAVRRAQNGGGYAMTGESGVAESGVTTMTGDYSLQGDEVDAAGAVITQDPSALASLLNTDVMIFLTIGVVIAGAIYYALTGVSIL